MPSNVGLPPKLKTYFTQSKHTLEGRCHNLNLRLVTKGRGCKVASQEKDSGVTSHAFESAKSVREWTFTLPSELPCWELDSQMDSQIFRARLQGLEPIASKSSLYHWKNYWSHMNLWKANFTWLLLVNCGPWSLWCMQLRLPCLEA
jgi:hypothetical protein